MLHSSELRNELQSLMSDITRVLAGAPANEIHSAAVFNLQAEAQDLQSHVAGMLSHPLERILLSPIAPLVTIGAEASESRQYRSSARPDNRTRPGPKAQA